LVSQLVDVDLAIDSQLLRTPVASADHGSYYVRLDTTDVAITWQALARVSGQASDPTSTLRIMGSKAIMHVDIDGLGYNVVNFRGQIVQAENQSAHTARLSTRRMLLGA
jgi:hypothetical protein